MQINRNYLESCLQLFEYYQVLGLKAMDQLKDEDLFRSYTKMDNSIAVIVKHIHGNMCSRWTDFLDSDGEKEWRNRDGEFEDSFTDRSTVYEKYNEGWECLFKAIRELTEEDLSKIIYIRNQGHTVLEAINRQLAHIPYHIGQIVYLARSLKKEDWTSLSIPKGKSQEFNNKTQSGGKRKEHFTTRLLDKS